MSHISGIQPELETELPKCDEILLQFYKLKKFRSVSWYIVDISKLEGLPSQQI